MRIILFEKVLFKYLLVLLAMVCFLLSLYQTAFAQTLRSGQRIGPEQLPHAPPDFDWSVFDFDRQHAKSLGDHMIDYDKAVVECTGFYDGRIPDAADMYYTQEKLDELGKCMSSKGYKFRAIDDFTLYEYIPTQQETLQMIEAAEKQSDKNQNNANSTPPESQALPLQGQESSAEKVDVLEDSDSKSLETVIEAEGENNKNQKRKPTHLFVPLDK